MPDLNSIGSHPDPVNTPVPGYVKKSAVTQVTVAASAFQVLALNWDRNNFKIENNSDADVFIKEGPGASATDFSIRIPTNSQWEPYTPVWRGLITGYGTGSGNLQVTEDV